MSRCDPALSRTRKRGYNCVLGIRGAWPHPEAFLATEGYLVGTDLKAGTALVSAC